MLLAAASYLAAHPTSSTLPLPTAGSSSLALLPSAPACPSPLRTCTTLELPTDALDHYYYDEPVLRARNEFYNEETRKRNDWICGHLPCRAPFGVNSIEMLAEVFVLDEKWRA